MRFTAGQVWNWASLGFATAVFLNAAGSLVSAHAQNTQGTGAGQAVAGPAIAATFRLEGIWAGVGYLDEEKLAAHLESMTEGPERDTLVNKAATYLSIAAALEFRPDGRLETDLEVQDGDGKVLREPTLGTWKALEKKENRILVELNEKLPDESERVSRRLIQFYDDGEHIALLMESDPLLTDFNPLIVLQRVPPTDIAQTNQPAAPPAGIKR